MEINGKFHSLLFYFIGSHSGADETQLHPLLKDNGVYSCCIFALALTTM